MNECYSLDRLRLAIPPRLAPTWALHAVEIRPDLGDRVYGFFGTPTFVGGAFALYPDDLCRTAADLAHQQRGAWPCYRKTPGPYFWLRPSEDFGPFMRTFEPDLLPEEPWTEYCGEGWYFRFDRPGRTTRRLVGTDIWVLDDTWLSLRTHCRLFAEKSMRAVPPARGRR